MALWVSRPNGLYNAVNVSGERERQGNKEGEWKEGERRREEGEKEKDRRREKEGNMESEGEMEQEGKNHSSY